MRSWRPPTVFDSFNHAFEGIIRALRPPPDRRMPCVRAIAALAITIGSVTAAKAWTGRGTPLRGGLPSGHGAIGFAAWVAVTYAAGAHHRFVVSSIAFVMALLVAQTRGESGVHSTLEVLLGALLGSLTTLALFQLAQQ